MGPLNFYGFGFMQLPVNGSPTPLVAGGPLPGYLTASDIIVRPSQFGIGLDFIGATPEVFNREILIPERYYITYTVDPPPIVAGDELRLDPPIGPVTVSRWTCPDTEGFDNAISVKNAVNGLEPSQFSATTFQCLDDSKPTPYFLQADGLDSTAPGLEASLTFNELARSVVVRMIIDLRPGNITGLDGIVSLSPVVVPEPAAFVPLAAGVAGLAFYVRRRRARQKSKMLNS